MQKLIYLWPSTDAHGHEKLSKTIRGRLFYRPFLWGLSYQHKDTSGTSWDSEPVYQASA